MNQKTSLFYLALIVIAMAGLVMLLFKSGLLLKTFLICLFFGIITGLKNL